MLKEAYNLAGQIAVVTGGGTGIGAAVAQLLAEAGADLVIAGRRMEPLEAMATDICETTGRRCLAIPTDVSQSAQVDELIAKTIDEFGRLDILINNAGGPVYSPLRAVTDEQWQSGLALNLNAAFYCSRAAYLHMKNQGGGVIVSISSIAGTHGSLGNGIYSTAKAGLQMFTRVAAAEWGPQGIRVNCVAPGMIATPLVQKNLAITGADARSIGQNFPLRRLGMPEEVAHAVLFLASNAGSYITGETITVAGGPSLKGLIDVSDSAASVSVPTST